MDNHIVGMTTKLKHLVPENIIPIVLYRNHGNFKLYNYGISTWGSTCKTYLDMISKLQKWAIVTISNSYYRSHIESLFSIFNVFYVYDTFTHLSLIVVHLYIYLTRLNQLQQLLFTYST